MLCTRSCAQCCHAFEPRYVQSILEAPRDSSMIIACSFLIPKRSKEMSNLYNNALSREKSKHHNTHAGPTALKWNQHTTFAFPQSPSASIRNTTTTTKKRTVMTKEFTIPRGSAQIRAKKTTSNVCKAGCLIRRAIGFILFRGARDWLAFFGGNPQSRIFRPFGLFGSLRTLRPLSYPQVRR